MARAAEAMDREHVGSYLRRQREARGMTLAQLSRATKIKEASLALLEEARFEALPARVFVVGWVGAVAKVVGADPGQAMTLLSSHVPAAAPVAIGECLPKVVARAPDEAQGSQRPLGERRRMRVALAVFLLLIVATLTLSLLLHHGGRVGGGMS
jgi:cytoskeletal protein RodZ